MEKKDLELIEKYRKKDENLADLYHEHLDIEKKLAKLDRKPFLNPQEKLERKNLQKQKLIGRDKIEKILTTYRSGESSL